MEEMGYDMSAYKEEEPIGGANARGPEGSHHDPAKEGIEAGSGLQPGWNREKQEDTSKPWNNCNRECDICTHTHCPNNQSRR